MSLPQSAATPAEIFTDADPPFSASESEIDGVPTDLILRTTDGIDFHVHKLILSYEFKDGKPIVCVHDDSSALQQLLPLCYPFIANSQPRTLDGVQGALVAADKYQMTAAIPLLLETLKSFLDDEPYRVFAIAIALRTKFVDAVNAAKVADLVDAAALATLEGPFLSKRRDIPELQSAQILLKLHDFRSECAVKAAGLCAKYSESELAEDVDPSYKRIYAAVWWSAASNDHDNGKLVRRAHETSHPSRENLSYREACEDGGLGPERAKYDLSRCAKCNEKPKADLEEFVVDELAARVTASNLETVRNTNFHLAS
ncbi:hypothetical protein B0H17DRAFT_1195038 [Mycena rosella]|uniref:BTB domain-containing protein n=1 Tax=Mycena rosella TaxID=1033263 RepID=A0AAD7GQN9_MYCRO|nr:hypothetical protein B0H17DRAFT_1195038 [Mycena rosella]